MSFTHFMTIGRFRYAADAREANLHERVVAHFVPGGLQQLQEIEGFVDPFTGDEVQRLEDELRRRFGVDANLRDYVSAQGLLCIPYCGLRAERFAQHVALIAHDLFRAVAGERGKLFDLAALRATSDAYVAEDAQARRLAAIADGAERVRETVRVLRRPIQGAPLISVQIAVDVIADVAPSAVSEIVTALTAEDGAVRAFAALTLERLGTHAVEAIPALVALVRASTTLSDDAYRAVSALAAMGRAAEEGLVLAVDQEDPYARGAAIDALGRLGEISEPTRARLLALAATTDPRAANARRALRRTSRGSKE